MVFTRHGDRTTKHYGAQALTRLGATQNFQVGSDYRARYIASGSPHRILGISEFDYVSSQVYATAPNQGILLNTATAFLQGLYPPLVGLNAEIATQTLNNGTNATSPLNGYQYVALQGVNDNSPDAIWIKGDDACPAQIEASASFETSTEFQARLANTRSFYQGFYPTLQSVYNYTPGSLSYAKAFDIFDLINVARIHNASSLARDVTEAQLLQLRTLADSAEFGYNFNASQPARSIHARTLAGALLSQLNRTVSSRGKLKFSLLAGSYDTFLAFFGLANLTSVSGDFYGLPGYASTMAFELFSDSDGDMDDAFPQQEAALRVRFMFRNGTEAGGPKAFPLFGSGTDSLGWKEFVKQMGERAITDVGDWCDLCKSKAGFCAAYRDTPSSSSSSSSSSSGGLSNVVAGVIGAVVTLSVVGVVGAVSFLLRKKRRAGTGKAVEPNANINVEKASLNSGTNLV